MQLLVPGGSNSATNLDIDFETFEMLPKTAIGEKYEQNPFTDVPPGILTEVPLS